MVRQNGFYIVIGMIGLFVCECLPANAAISASASSNPSTNVTNVPKDSNAQTNTAPAVQNITSTDISKTVIAKINQLREQNQIAQAKTLANKYLQKYPDDLDVMLLLGLINYQQQNYHDALSIFEKILAQRPEYLDAKLAIIRIKVIQKKYPEAKLLIQQAKEAAPDNSDVQSVENFYLKATQQPTTTKNAEVLKQIKALRDKKQLTRALQVATTYLASNPKDADVRLYLGLIYFQQSRFDDAETIFNAVLAQAPTYTDAKIGLFRVKLAKRQRKQAYALLQQISKESPNNPELPALQKQYKSATSTQGVSGQKKK